MPTYEHVRDLWDDTVANALDPLGRLVYRSNLLGSDQRITNTGGGNTSSKLIEADPLTGEKVEILWIKGSGGDLRTSKKENFSSLYQSKLIALQKRYASMPSPGPKTSTEDAMVGMYNHCTFNLNPRACSIDTPLHSFVPYKHVDHTHPNACIAIAAAANSEKLTRDVYGDDVIWLPWQRPGFDLGLQLQEVCRKHPKSKGVILGQHGLINWANDDKACYYLSLDLIEKASRFIAAKDRGNKTFSGKKVAEIPGAKRQALLVAILPWLRGQLSTKVRMIATVQDDAATMEFINSADAARLAELGTSCPDHFLRTKIKPMCVDWNPTVGEVDALKHSLAHEIPLYRANYAVYYEKHRRPDSPAMRDANPTVFLIPGVGMIAWGKDKSESRVTAEFYGCAIQVMRGAEAIDRYIALPQQEAFDIEYWLLEEAKLRRMPPEKELARRVFAVVGAGSGIGKETAHRLSREGAHVACVDLDQKTGQATADEIVAKLGPGIGVAGSGVSGCGPAVGLGADVTRRASVRQMLDTITLAYGGLDGIAVTAGIFVPPDLTGHIPDDQWATTFAINVTGAYLVADEAGILWRDQNLPATFVVTTSANAVVAKKGSVAYDVSKAAANHLIRELAIELAPLVRVNGVAPATVVQGSSMFPRDRVIASLMKYAIAFDPSESDGQLRENLAKFYAERTLTRLAITPADQADAIFLLLGDRLAKTTGQIIAVDGGLVEGFMR
jgi:rhamnulose-1-phosphate aldolase/alcohol dehydrogenase